LGQREIRYIRTTIIIIAGLIHIEGKEEASYKDILHQLEQAYCGELSVELHHLQVEKICFIAKSLANCPLKQNKINSEVYKLVIELI